MQGKIVKQISNSYTVRCEDMDYVCIPRGKFRIDGLSPLVGDNAVIDGNSIVDILPRKNYLDRPRIANVDIAVIVTSLKRPDLDTNLLDKLLAVITFNNIKPVIVFTKKDLLSEEEVLDFLVYFNYYKKIGIDVYTNDEIDKIRLIFKDKISVFTGQSGAGKSTLLNRLDSNLDLKTGEVSKALNRGRHTTRHTELLTINGGLVADTPGFSFLEFNGMTKGDIRDSFIEFNLYRGKCRYSDCMHDKEDKCAIKEHLGKDILTSRYDNYINFIHKYD